MKILKFCHFVFHLLDGYLKYLIGISVCSVFLNTTLAASIWSRTGAF